MELSPDEITNKPEWEPARTTAEWYRLCKQRPAGLVLDHASWREFVSDRPTRINHPLSKFSDEELAAFERGLKFTERGLGGFDFSPLLGMPFRDAISVLAWFGMGLGVFADHMGYECEKAGTCGVASTKICTSNC